MNRYQMRALVASTAGVLVLFGLTFAVLSVIRPVFASGVLATTNTVPRFISSSGRVGDSSISDDLIIVSTSEPTSTGNPTARSLINGPTIQSWVLTDPLYAFGEINRREFTGSVPTFPRDLFVDVVRGTVTADTTGGAARAGGAAFEMDCTRSAGANPVNCIGAEFSAIHGQTNNAVELLAGDLTVDNGNIVSQVGYIFEQDAAGFIAALGTIYAENGGTNAIDISGAPVNSMRIRNAAGAIDMQNAGASVLRVYNSNAGLVTLQVDGVASPERVTANGGAPAAVCNGAGASTVTGGEHKAHVAPPIDTTTCALTFGHSLVSCTCSLKTTHVEVASGVGHVCSFTGAVLTVTAAPSWTLGDFDVDCIAAN